VDGEPEREFSEFMARRHRDLVRSAFVLIGDRQRAEDLVQTALFRTFTAWSRLRSVDTAESYARTTMVRLALRWRARRWTSEIATGDVPESPLSADDDDAVMGVDVWRALRTLAVEQRAVLVLRYLEDLSEAETAAVLHCSIGTVKSRASRALDVLRSCGLLDDTRGVSR
jgi:RNA polymerase sigma-70 factor (sigma-E family)